MAGRIAAGRGLAITYKMQVQQPTKTFCNFMQKRLAKNIGEGSMTYSIGHHRFIEMARAAGAVYKIGEAKGNTILINLEVFDEYMEQFREPPTEMKHPLPNVKGD